MNNAIVVAPVDSFSELPLPKEGMIALDLSLRINNNKQMAWMVVDGDWVNVELAVQYQEY